MNTDQKPEGKYELMLSTFPKAIVYQPAGNVLAHPTPSGEPAVLAFLSAEQASEFIAGLSTTGKASEPGQIVSLMVRDWIPIAESLIAAGVKDVAVLVGAQEIGSKIAVVPLADLLEAAKEFAARSRTDCNSRRG